MRRAGAPMLLRISMLIAALSLAAIVAATAATPLHSEPSHLSVQEARFAEPMAVEQPVAIAKGFQSEPPRIRPEPAVAPETRNLKLKISQQRKAEQQRAQRQEAARQQAQRQAAKQQEAARQEATRQEAERREAERKEAERQEAQRQKAKRQKAERKKAKAASEAATRKVESLPAGVSERTQADRTRPASAEGKPAARRPAPRGGKMALTIGEIGLRNSPIETSEEQRVLDRGLMHLSQTSRPWERGKARNVYVVGHRMGWPGTKSWKIFYRLDELQSGDQLVLTAGDDTYRYKVTEKLVVSPWDVWVTDPVKDRDLLSLQTCTGPNFSKRLIIRADRV